LTPRSRNVLTERFVTALEDDAQVYRRILNTICSLGTTLLQRGTLMNATNKHCKTNAMQRANTAMSEHSVTK